MKASVLTMIILINRHLSVIKLNNSAINKYDSVIKLRNLYSFYKLVKITYTNRMLLIYCKKIKINF